MTRFQTWRPAFLCSEGDVIKLRPDERLNETGSGLAPTAIVRSSPARMEARAAGYKDTIYVRHSEHGAHLRENAGIDSEGARALPFVQKRDCSDRRVALIRQNGLFMGIHALRYVVGRNPR